MEKKWFAVYTKPRWEKKVAENLSKFNIECYCPLNKVTRQWSDRKKIVLEPLFTSYVFVKVDEKEFANLLICDGIINFVHWLGKPATIRDIEIETIKRFMNEHSNVKLEKTDVQVKDFVRVMSGPLMEMEGHVIAVRNRTVRVVLPSLGYVLAADIMIENIELISQQKII